MENKDYFIHTSSYIDEPENIGKGTKIWHFCHIMNGSKIGEKCILGQNVFVAPQVIIGNNVKIQNNVSLYTGVICEDDVFLGPSVVFTNVINPRSYIERKNEFKKTIVKKGATVGANATIVCGITVGKYAFIGAGSVVTADVPDYGLILGVPGRIAGFMCYCGYRLPADDEDTYLCSYCNRRYVKCGNTIKEICEV